MADFVDVTRCKDCIYYIPAKEMLLHHRFNGYDNLLGADGICDNCDKWTNETDYCSRATARIPRLKEHIVNVECFGYVQKAHADSYTEHDIQTLLVCDKITSLANCVKIVKVEETEDSPFIEVTGEIKVGVEDEEIDS